MVDIVLLKADARPSYVASGVLIDRFCLRLNVDLLSFPAILLGFH